MPYYDFRCEDCQHQFELVQGMMEEHKAICPLCGKPAQRIYGYSGHYYAHPEPLFHKDGSYEER